MFPPLYIGYYQDKHYQSFEFVPTQDEDPEDVQEEVTMPMDDVIEDVHESDGDSNDTIKVEVDTDDMDISEDEM